MTQANLSETLFKPRFKHPETSTLVRRFNHGAFVGGANVSHCQAY
ncbi:TPA: alpha/beta hydrolase, partial [Escherichia coli]|nr:alpha/beta hydrolase [Escherichia coli]